MPITLIGNHLIATTIWEGLKNLLPELSDKELLEKYLVAFNIDRNEIVINPDTLDFGRALLLHKCEVPEIKSLINKLWSPK